MNPKSRSKKPVKGRNPSNFRGKEAQLELSLIRTYPKQAVWETWLPGAPTKLVTTVTTGVIASTLPVSATSITSFTTRFASTFVEYRIIRAHWRLRFFSSTNPGVIQFWIDEKSASAPTLAEAQERATRICSASGTNLTPSVSWVCADPLDLQYIATSAATTVASFKSYTNNANFGSSIVATDYLEVEPEFQVQFRGLQGV